MDTVRGKSVENIINGLSKIIYISEEEKSKKLDKYKTYTDEMIMEDLFVWVFRYIGINSPYYDYALSLVNTINPNIFPDLELVKKDLLDSEYNVKRDVKKKEDYSDILIGDISKLTTLLNDCGSDYYLTGFLPIFLKNGISITDIEDIEILINEDDLDKVKSVFYNSNYTYHDDRFPKLQRYYEKLEEGNDYSLTFYNLSSGTYIRMNVFRREEDNSITIKEYSHHLDKSNKVVTDVKEFLSDSFGTALRFDDEAFIYNDAKFRMVTPEYVYEGKKLSREDKDIEGMKKIKELVDEKKLELLSMFPRSSYIRENVKESIEVVRS